MSTLQRFKSCMRKAGYLAVACSAALCLTGISYAADQQPPEQHASGDSTTLQLSQDIKVILNQEMMGIQKGLMDMIPAIASAEWEKVAAIATQIRDSFILKQKLSQEQMQELHRSLPSEFVAMDKSFHVTAEKLSHAASREDGELVNFYYYRLYSQCLPCHSAYASQRFPNVKKSPQGKTEHH